MAEYLVFRLYGPLVSWGDIAVGGTRPSNDHPTRSAVLGLVAGAFGLRREQEDNHRQLDEALGLAVYAWSTGQLLRDYHTIQTPHATKGEHYRSRADELRATKIGTVLSQRDYRCDALYDVCLWQAQSDSPYSLTSIRGALIRPSFVPYLGRKSCVPALPFAPMLVDAPDCLQAIRDLQSRRSEAMLQLEQAVMDQLDNARGNTIGQDNFYWEGESDAPVQALQTVTRRDRPLSRSRWQFTSREEHFAPVTREV